MLGDMVLETTTNPGTSTTVNLAGAETGFVGFASAFSTGASIYYVLRDGTQWEAGSGTFTTGSPNTISRTTVISNSAGNTSRLNFTGLTQVYCAVPASRSVHLNNIGTLSGATATAISTPIWGGTAGGTANALTISPSPAITSYVAGQIFAFIVGSADNSGAATININGLGARNLRRADGATSLASGDLKANTVALISYDGTQFRFLSGEGKYLPLSGGTVSGSTTFGSTTFFVGTSQHQGTLEVTSGNIFVRAGAVNRNVWFTNLAGAEGAVIWNEPSSNTLNLRAGGGPQVSINSAGSVTIPGSLSTTGTGTFAGNLTVSKADPLLVLTKTGSGQPSRVQGQVAGALRWTLDLGDISAETGGNAGSDFILARYADGGGFLDIPFRISRVNGAVTAGGTISTGGARMLGAGVGFQTLGFFSAGGNDLARLGNGNPNWADIIVDAIHVPSSWAGVNFNIGNVSSFSFRQDGNGYASGSWISLSDARLKTDQQPITGALDKVASLQGFTYIREDLSEMDGSHPRQAGLRAQDVVSVLPEAVKVSGPAPAFDPDGEGTLALDYNAVIALAINAINELREKLDAAEARIHVLETTT
jgi:hypothetical protein